ncbi:hypothetical protein [Roseateles sp. BYS87W]|uniref:Uncharacterized protein n=1 Tax=Pelomonas baiyunensis TaxID=3299026 RepID=A0ABW7GZU6_9BURK
MEANLISTPAYELGAKLGANEQGYNLELWSFVPTARRPEPHRKLQATLSKDGLLRLRWLIDDVLRACGETELDRPQDRKPIVYPPGKGPHAASLFLYQVEVNRRNRLAALQSLDEGRTKFTTRELASLAQVLSRALADRATKEEFDAARALQEE